MPARPYVTLHAPMPRFVSSEILEYLDGVAKKYRVRYWVEREEGDVTVMVDLPQVWIDRAPTEKELALMDQLLEEGSLDQYEDLLQRGMPESMR